jgi:transposase-like protein
VAIVWICSLDVGSYAVAGRDVEVPRPRCPGCRRRMIFWPGYPRYVRRRGSPRIWVRRAKCQGCSVSHALLPAFLLLRRLDPVSVIGDALVRMIGGVGARPAAEAAGVPHSTARSWRRRYRARAPALVAALTGLLVDRSSSSRRREQAFAAVEEAVSIHRRLAEGGAGRGPSPAEALR